MNIQEYLELKQKLFKKSDEISILKSKSYSNIADDPFKNVKMSSLIHVKPAKGILIRLLDKISRIDTYVDGNGIDLKDEKFEDCIIDAINYLTMIYAIVIGQQNDLI
jgi:hypothetical protein